MWRASSWGARLAVCASAHVRGAGTCAGVCATSEWAMASRCAWGWLMPCLGAPSGGVRGIPPHCISRVGHTHPQVGQNGGAVRVRERERARECVCVRARVLTQYQHNSPPHGCGCVCACRWACALAHRPHIVYSYSSRVYGCSRRADRSPIRAYTCSIWSYICALRPYIFANRTNICRTGCISICQYRAYIILSRAYRCPIRACTCVNPGL